jgi:hypothetical protein
MNAVDSKRNAAVSNSSLLLYIDLLARNVVRRALVRVSRSAHERSVSEGVEICDSQVAWAAYRVRSTRPQA